MSTARPDRDEQARRPGRGAVAGLVLGAYPGRRYVLDVSWRTSLAVGSGAAVAFALLAVRPGGAFRHRSGSWSHWI